VEVIERQRGVMTHKGNGMSKGLRTERVTLEITYGTEDSREPGGPSDWPWEAILREWGLGDVYPGESVRVVPSSDADAEIERLRRDRDAALARVAELEKYQGGEPVAWRSARSQPPEFGKMVLCRWVVIVCGNRQVSYGEASRRPDGMYGKANHVEMMPPIHWMPLPAGPSEGRDHWEADPASSREPQPLLTAEERETVEKCLRHFVRQEIAFLERNDPGNRRLEVWRREEAILRALLARSTPPMVKVPPGIISALPHEREQQWIAAIRAAGGEVEG